MIQDLIFFYLVLWFMPQNQTLTAVTVEVMNLLIFFDEGFVPKGIFSGLLGSLCKEGWEITYNADGEPQLFRNKVVLSVEIEGFEYSIDCTITATSTHSS